MTDHFRFHRRAQDCIAQNALTNSKRVECFVKGVYPTHLKRGQGCWVWDHDNRRYLDMICGLGANLLGYAHAQVNQAIQDQMAFGATLSLSTHVELEAAELLKQMFPFVDAVKFLKTGSEACSAAIRIARAVTGKDIILSDGYHGWSDDFASLMTPSYGVPKILNDEDRSLRPIFPLGNRKPMGVAAVIVEPVITDMSPGRIEWLRALREECTKHGALLIFDECVTGFRFPKFSVASCFGVTPDLIILGKAIANGMPLAAVGGKYAVMNADYFVSSTFAGETLSLAAAKKTIELLLSNKADVNHLWQKGQAFIQWFNGLYFEKLRLVGYPTRGAFQGDPVTLALFFQEMCLAGMLVGPSWYLNFPAAEEIDNAKGAIRAIVDKIIRGEVQLKGEMPKAAVAQTVRGATA